MTLDRHRIDGIEPITSKVLPAQVFDDRLVQAGYTKAGSAPGEVGAVCDDGWGNVFGI